MSGLARFGEDNAATTPFQELYAEVPLDHLNLHAHGGLSHDESLGRGAEALTVNDGAEDFKMSKVHGSPRVISSQDTTRSRARS
jgi:hypothetical protein